jgi:hypothetical protein
MQLKPAIASVHAPWVHGSGEQSSALIWHSVPVQPGSQSHA